LHRVETGPQDQDGKSDPVAVLRRADASRAALGWVWSQLDGHHVRVDVGDGVLASDALRELMPSCTWASTERADRPALALHHALCRGAGLRPDARGTAAQVARHLGQSRAAYHHVLQGGGLDAAARWCRLAGLALVALPDGRVVVAHPAALGLALAALS